MKISANIQRAFLVILSIAFGSSLTAQINLGTTDNQVNTTTVSSQTRPVAAQAGAGSGIIVWECAEKDGDGFGISRQLFSSPGITSGSETTVNSSTTGNQRFPDVAMDDSGNHVVVWMTNSGAAASRCCRSRW